MNIKAMAWSMLKPLIIPWLHNRALVIPVAKRVEIAKHLGTTQDVVAMVNEAIIEQAMAELDRFRP